MPEHLGFTVLTVVTSASSGVLPTEHNPNFYRHEIFHNFSRRMAQSGLLDLNTPKERAEQIAMQLCESAEAFEADNGVGNLRAGGGSPVRVYPR